MSIHRVVLISLVGLVGCDQEIVPKSDGAFLSDLKCPQSPDMLPPVLKCPAAKGLGGDNLICIDFSQVAGLTDAKLASWDFTSMGGGCWEIVNGKLQVKNFSTFMSSCGFLMPAVNLNDADKQKYSSVTLSVLQRVDLVPSQQTAQASLGSPLPARTFWSTTGKTEHQQLMISMSRTDPVPTSASGSYQYLFQLVSGAMAGSLQGWQLESIAVNATP